MNSGRRCIGNFGPSRGGILKEAKIVRESRTVKRRYVAAGMGRAATGEKSFVKCVSFHRQRERFAIDVAANLGVPWVVDVYGVFLMVDDAVSMLLAVKYVPEYNVCGSISIGRSGV
jgi:hypothetical protein